MKRAVLCLIRLYQTVLSPYWPGVCRYVPSCSWYAREAVEILGVWQGGLLAIGRLLRCRPFGGSGYDQVPYAGGAFAVTSVNGGETRSVRPSEQL